MKKSLLAIAAMTAFAGAAQAQSSVTVYGIMDAGYGAVTNNTTTNGTEVKTKAATTGAVSGQQSSRIGFRGVEDMGGGTSAVFTIEQGLNAWTENQATSPLTSRVVFAGLSDKKLGSAYFGRQYQSIHSLVSASSAGGANNTVGALYSGAASNGSLANSSTVRPYAVYIDNAITYVSPAIAGVTLEVQTAQKTSTTSESSGTTAGVESGGSLKYEGIKNLLVGYGISQKATVVPGTSNVRITAQVLAATYDFGIAKAFFTGTQTKVDNLQGASVVNLSDLKLYEVGVKAPVTKVINVWASGLSGSVNSGTNNAAQTGYNFTAYQAHGDVKGFQLGAEYNMSKRTNLYGIYGQQSITGKDAAVNDKIASSQYSVGVRHTF
jgi:predicted porin